MKLLALLPVLALVVITSVASAEVVANTSVPLAGSINNPCNGEAVSFEADAHLVARITQDNSDGLHAGIHVNLEATGLGADTGAKYTGHGVLNANINGVQGGPAEGTLVLNFGMIAQGKVPNFVLKVTLHATVNANGDLTATVVNFEPSCH